MCLPDGVVSLGAAEATIALAEAHAYKLDEWQEVTLRAAMGTHEDGLWAATQVGNAVSRQNGKGDIIQARELFGLTVLGEQIMHTAHEVPTAKNAFLRLVGVLESSPELWAEVVHVRYTNGDQGIEFENGGQIVYRARTERAGRGLDKISLVVYDEAQHLKVEQLAASSPTGLVADDAQQWFAGSAGFAFSEVWWGMRLRALRALLAGGKRGRLCWVELTAEQLSFDEGGALVSAPVDMFDRANWAAANPALGGRMREASIENQLMLGDKFPGEHLGVWVPLPDDAKAAPPKVDAGEWSATGGHVLPLSANPVVLAFSVSRDGEWSSIAVGADSVASPYVEVVAHERGTGWLPARLAELAKKYGVPVGCNAAGATGGQVAAVQLALTEAGVKDPLRLLSGPDYWRACAGIFADIREGRLRRPREQGPLDLAVSDAAERVSGSQWQWAPITGSVPLSPLEAVTVARALLPVAPVKSKVMQTRHRRG